MKNIFVFMANGFEEIEALVPVDVWRRAGYSVSMVSITDNLNVTGSHQITVKADLLFEEANFDSADVLFLPGGMPGTLNLYAHQGLKSLLINKTVENKIMTAICAAPLVLGRNNLLVGHSATCFPGYEKDLTGAKYTGAPVEVCGNIITARGAGVAFEFSLKVVEFISGNEEARLLSDRMQMAFNP